MLLKHTQRRAPPRPPPRPTGPLPASLVKLPDRMNADERRAAAAAAREWEADRLRTQQLLARLADRAEAAELALAEARCASRGAGGAAGEGGGCNVNAGNGRVCVCVRVCECACVCVCTHAFAQPAPCRCFPSLRSGSSHQHRMGAASPPRRLGPASGTAAMDGGLQAEERAAMLEAELNAARWGRVRCTVRVCVAC
jgi:hypothetical protein